MQTGYFRVEGADLETGEEAYLVLQAPTSDEAEAVARKQGLLVSSIRAATAADWGAAPGVRVARAQPKQSIRPVVFELVSPDRPKLVEAAPPAPPPRVEVARPPHPLPTAATASGANGSPKPASAAPAAAPPPPIPPIAPIAANSGSELRKDSQLQVTPLDHLLAAEVKPGLSPVQPLTSAPPAAPRTVPTTPTATPNSAGAKSNPATPPSRVRPPSSPAAEPTRTAPKSESPTVAAPAPKPSRPISTVPPVLRSAAAGPERSSTTPGGQIATPGGASSAPPALVKPIESADLEILSADVPAAETAVSPAKPTNSQFSQRGSVVQFPLFSHSTIELGFREEETLVGGAKMVTPVEAPARVVAVPQNELPASPSAEPKPAASATATVPPELASLTVSGVVSAAPATFSPPAEPTKPDIGQEISKAAPEASSPPLQEADDDLQLDLESLPFAPDAPESASNEATSTAHVEPAALSLDESIALTEPTAEAPDASRDSDPVIESPAAPAAEVKAVAEEVNVAESKPTEAADEPLIFAVKDECDKVETPVIKALTAPANESPSQEAPAAVVEDASTQAILSNAESTPASAEKVTVVIASDNTTSSDVSSPQPGAEAQPKQETPASSFSTEVALWMASRPPVDTVASSTPDEPAKNNVESTNAEAIAVVESPSAAGDGAPEGQTVVAETAAPSVSEPAKIEEDSAGAIPATTEDAASQPVAETPGDSQQDLPTAARVDQYTPSAKVEATISPAEETPVSVVNESPANNASIAPEPTPAAPEPTAAQSATGLVEVSPTTELALAPANVIAVTARPVVVPRSNLAAVEQEDAPAKKGATRIPPAASRTTIPPPRAGYIPPGRAKGFASRKAPPNPTGTAKGAVRLTPTTPPRRVPPAIPAALGHTGATQPPQTSAAASTQASASPATKPAEPAPASKAALQVEETVTTAADLPPADSKETPRDISIDPTSASVVETVFAPDSMEASIVATLSQSEPETSAPTSPGTATKPIAPSDEDLQPTARSSGARFARGLAAGVLAPMAILTLIGGACFAGWTMLHPPTAADSTDIARLAAKVDTLTSAMVGGMVFGLGIFLLVAAALLWHTFSGKER